MTQLPGKRFAEVNGRRLAYVEVGSGAPIEIGRASCRERVSYSV